MRQWVGFFRELTVEKKCFKTYPKCSPMFLVHKVIYTKSNLIVLAKSTLNDFKIHPGLTEKRVGLLITPTFGHKMVL